MSKSTVMGLLEAVLFACGEPIEISKLAAGLSLEKAAVREQLELYANRLEKDDRGLELLFLGESVQLCSKKCYEDQIASVISSRKNTPLSGAAMEVLAIIAYNQPVTKSFVEQVRGVESSQVVNNLVEKELVEEAGRLDIPGRPVIYRTTSNFLRCFGLSSLSELPRLPGEDERDEESDQLSLPAE
ncbi:MAG: SMC-Scp complex subunit ScpB [Candidatus Merdivicinus sp.]|jgi:segregation and condensation protein B